MEWESEMQTIPDRFSGLGALPPDRRFVAFDYPGLKIGIAEYDEGPTGCTVLSFDASATCVSDMRGGGSVQRRYKARFWFPTAGPT
jgi:L-aminopeptidase/D-esterase-like protein